MEDSSEYKIAQAALGYGPEHMAVFMENIKSPHRYMWHLDTIHRYRKNTKMKLKMAPNPDGKGYIIKVLEV